LEAFDILKHGKVDGVTLLMTTSQSKQTQKACKDFRLKYKSNFNIDTNRVRVKCDSKKSETIRTVIA